MHCVFSHYYSNKHVKIKILFSRIVKTYSVPYRFQSRLTINATI